MEKVVVNNDSSAPFNLRRWAYPLISLGIYLVWTSYMALGNHWALFKEFWPVSLTMTLGGSKQLAVNSCAVSSWEILLPRTAN